MAFRGVYPIRAKNLVDKAIIVHVHDFIYLVYSLTYDRSSDVENKISKFNYIYGTIKRTFKTHGKGRA